MDIENIHINRYGFDLDWFLCNCFLRTEEIDTFYEKYYLDYKKFINSFCDHFNISDSERENCLKAEKRCICCQKNYPYVMDSFVYIKSKNKDITEELCYDCIQNTLRCDKCNVDMYQEPYTVINYDNRMKHCPECN